MNINKIIKICFASSFLGYILGLIVLVTDYIKNGNIGEFVLGIILFIFMFSLTTLVAIIGLSFDDK